VPRGSRFRFTIHYSPDGVACSDRTRMGFVLAKQPPVWIATSESRGAEDLLVPPGSRVTFTDSYLLPAPILLRSLSPHMHLRGTGFRVEAWSPSGGKQVLLELDGWDPDWQYSYEFREWRALPKGTRLYATAWYDNSAANPRNPDPTATVRNGPQTAT